MHQYSETVRKAIGYWLILGCVLIFFQVVIGGVTRLTGSGLSITEWKPLVGAIPPTNDVEWQKTFDAYKEIVQFKHLNQDMNLSEFKQIFFWEYFHRLWARFMGFAFIIPFAFFIYKKWIDKNLLIRLGVILVGGGIVGFYGWIMVKNGLTGLYVPPVFLSIHLILALSLFAYLVWLATYMLRGHTPMFTLPSTLKRHGIAIVVLLFVQLILGGIVSGMKAGLAYPTWPLMNGEFFPTALNTLSPTLSGVLHYDPSDFWGRTMIQFVHRMVAYTLFVMIFYFSFRMLKISTDKTFRVGVLMMPITVSIQALIGIITVLNCKGSIPVSLGVLHQAGAMLLLANVMFVEFHLTRK
ncbi:MAG: COX15/CtaA family protein [Chitinophagales bacterium]|nr:COX15/CtaA family protein [Chitinophagales bacterium]